MPTRSFEFTDDEGQRYTFADQTTDVYSAAKRKSLPVADQLTVAALLGGQWVGSISSEKVKHSEPSDITLKPAATQAEKDGAAWFDADTTVYSPEDHDDVDDKTKVDLESAPSGATLSARRICALRKKGIEVAATDDAVKQRRVIASFRRKNQTQVLDDQLNVHPCIQETDHFDEIQASVERIKGDLEEIMAFERAVCVRQAFNASRPREATNDEKAALPECRNYTINYIYVIYNIYVIL